MQKEPLPFEQYPIKTVVIVWLINLIVYVTAVYLLWQFDALLGKIFIAFLIILEISVYQEGCTVCYYYGKRCYCGRGKIVPLFFKKGDRQKFCSKKVTFLNLLPHALVALLPLAIGIVLLIRDFNWLILVFTSVPLLNWFIGNHIVFGCFACPHCQQGRICCPAQDFFGKKKK